jgi:hypothetical protein
MITNWSGHDHGQGPGQSISETFIKAHVVLAIIRWSGWEYCRSVTGLAKVQGPGQSISETFIKAHVVLAIIRWSGWEYCRSVTGLAKVQGPGQSISETFIKAHVVLAIIRWSGWEYCRSVTGLAKASLRNQRRSSGASSLPNWSAFHYTSNVDESTHSIISRAAPSAHARKPHG